MSLDGLRAWIGEVERKLGMRTRVFLVLTVIAIGIGGAAIYLAIDARESSVSESDVQALQERLEARIDTGSGSAGVDVTQLEAELDTLRAQVEQLAGEGGASGKSNDSGARGSSGGASTGSSNEAGSSTDSGGASTGGATDSAKLGELLEQVKKQNAEAEEEQAGK